VRRLVLPCEVSCDFLIFLHAKQEKLIDVDENHCSEFHSNLLVTRNCFRLNSNLLLTHHCLPPLEFFNHSSMPSTSIQIRYLLIPAFHIQLNSVLTHYCLWYTLEFVIRSYLTSISTRIRHSLITAFHIHSNSHHYVPYTLEFVTHSALLFTFTWILHLRTPKF
jgi:hypothetical protein